MGRFISILKVILQIGGVALPAVINTLSPGLGTLISTVLNSILQSEGKFGPGSGSNKLDYALEIIQPAIPGIVQLIEAQSGRRLADEAMFAEGIRDLTNALVKVLNSFKMMAPVVVVPVVVTPPVVVVLPVVPSV